MNNDTKNGFEAIANDPFYGGIYKNLPSYEMPTNPGLLPPGIQPPNTPISPPGQIIPTDNTNLYIGIGVGIGLFILGCCIAAYYIYKKRSRTAYDHVTNSSPTKSYNSTELENLDAKQSDSLLPSSTILANPIQGNIAGRRHGR